MTGTFSYPYFFIASLSIHMREGDTSRIGISGMRSNCGLSTPIQSNNSLGVFSLRNGTAKIDSHQPSAILALGACLRTPSAAALNVTMNARYRFCSSSVNLSSGSPMYSGGTPYVSNEVIDVSVKIENDGISGASD